MLRVAAALAPGGDETWSGILARAGAGLGASRLALGHAEEALAHYERALELARVDVDGDARALALLGSGASYVALGKHGMGLEAYAAALSAARAAGAPGSSRKLRSS